MLKVAAVFVIATSLVGCASIVNETTHPMRVETKTASGQTVTGASCKMTNDYGTVNFKSGETVQVRRSSKDLDFICAQPGEQDATGRAISRANAGLAGNILFGGAVGAIIDHNRGTAYTYPTWVQLIFGEALIFDRRAEKEGSPVEPTQTPTSIAAAGTQAAPVAAPVATAAVAPAPTLTPTNLAPAQPSTAVALAVVSAPAINHPVVPAAPQAPTPQQVMPKVIELAQADSSSTPQKPQTGLVPFRAGRSSVTVERLAKQLGCEGSRGAGLLTPDGTVEVYRMACQDGRAIYARCEYAQCSVQ
jgi:hypothetical protein